MSEPAEEQVIQAFAESGPVILAAGPREVRPGCAPAPDETWELPNGMAWVYYAGQRQGLTRPVILADGLAAGPSTLECSWTWLELGGYPMISEMRRRGLDVILLGFRERSASILENARTAKAAIMRTAAQRAGSAPLAVGGLSAGGLAARYALAEMEFQGIDHQTQVCWSYDSPHRGAWIPISLQAFAHAIRRLDSGFSDQVNSEAARQLLWRHIGERDATPAQDQRRTDFLARLESVGGWPRIPRLIAVANGVSTGAGTGLQPGAIAVEGKGSSVAGLRLHIQAPGTDQLVAELPAGGTGRPQPVLTSGLPDIDAAPGGTLAGFQLLAQKLNALPEWLGYAASAYIASHCFVPVVSALDFSEPATSEDLYAPVAGLDPSDSGLDEFRCASQNEEHTAITEELVTWLLDRMRD